MGAKLGKLEPPKKTVKINNFSYFFENRVRIIDSFYEPCHSALENIWNRLDFYFELKTDRL